MGKWVLDYEALKKSPEAPDHPIGKGMMAMLKGATFDFEEESFIKKIPAMDLEIVIPYKIILREDNRITIEQLGGDRNGFRMIITIVDSGTIRLFEPRDPAPFIMKRVGH
jgi:hypothetical protein